MDLCVIVLLSLCGLLRGQDPVSLDDCCKDGKDRGQESQDCTSLKLISSSITCRIAQEQCCMTVLDDNICTGGINMAKDQGSCERLLSTGTCETKTAKLSYRGRVLIINNLAVSMLWHKLTDLNPPKDFFIKIQKAFIDFFWNGHHWLPPGVLYLPVAEGGQGLIHLESKMKAMRLQTLKKVLYWTEGVSWIPFSLILLQNMTNVKLDKQLFLIEKSDDPGTRLSYVDFYTSVLKAWGLFEIMREKNEHYGILEPLFFNPLFKIQPNVLNSFIAMFSKAGIIRIIDLLDLHNNQWKSVQTLADQVGLRSVRTMDGFINSLKVSFPSGFLSFLNEYIYNDAVPQKCGNECRWSGPLVEGL